jgi:hypothetical protein
LVTGNEQNRSINDRGWMPVGTHLLAALIALLLFLRAQQSIAQSTAPLQVKTDTTKAQATHIRQRRPGFDLPDSLYVPSDSVRGDIDTIVQYNAKDSIVFDVKKRTMLLVDQAQMHFQTRDLSAYSILMDFNTNKLHAYSYDYDSVLTSSLAHRRRIIRDTARTKSRGAPELVDAGTKYDGEIILYDFKDKRGTVQLGTTEMEGGFYYGERIKEVAPGTLFVENGRFTTCDAPTPHYYFESPKMKVILKDQVFAEPVFLYIADVPVFALPFGMFPNHSTGRVSGIIPPNYQTSGDRGYGLTHLGYFQVIDDYADAAIRSDIYTKGGYNVAFNAEYMKRYLLQGPISLNVGYGLTRYNSVDPYTQNWLLGFALPGLNIDYSTNMSANLSFQSSGYFRNNAQNISDVLNQNISSSAQFSHNWDDAGVSFSANYFRNQDLNTGNWTENSPSITISKSAFAPFAPPIDEVSGDQTIWQTINISASVNASRQYSRTLTQIPTDTNLQGQVFPGDTSYVMKELYGLTYNPSITISPKLGYISITPSFNYSGAVFLKKIVSRTPYISAKDSSVQFNDVIANGFNHVYNYDMGVSLGTTLYGIANIGAFGVEAVRHTISPSIGFSYHPDFGNQEYRSYTDPITKQQVQYDIYQNNLNAGFDAPGKSGNLSFSLGNNFEAKIKHEISKDSSTEEKVQLLNLTMGSGYDLIQKQFGGFNLGASSSIGQYLSISGNANYSFYPANAEGSDSIAHTLIALHEGWLRPISASFSLNGNLSSAQTSQGQNVDSLRRLIDVTNPDDEREALLGGYFPGKFVSVPYRPTWSISYGISYTEYYSIVSTTRNLSANLTLSFSPTRNWSFQTSAAYDLISKSIVIPQLTIHRDLHCWELNFNYRPTGIIRGYNFEIRIKADQLKDIKLMRSESQYGQF